MGYTALYRKFRPSAFDEVCGQDHIVKTLKNQIKANRLGHAYLFCGTRGTGKTSIAKIFAKAVNCEHPVDGSPCNECASCRAIAAGASMNVIEIDAASNNGVDNIREIREEVAYSPTTGRYKVYIIDEVHMLSIGAFNALLKTLEEPPSYVIFILATTEAHKIPVTILSRCQRYDFRRIGQETILEHLKELTKEEQVEAEEKALRYIAKKGDGSMRDALSLLDQCISFYLGETLTYDRVLEVLGAVDTDVFSDLLRKVLRGDLTAVIGTLEKLIMQGRDLTQLVNDFTWYLRNLMLLKASEDMEDVLDVSTENLAQLREEAAMVRSDTLMRFIRIFSELANSIRYATNRRVLVEMALIKLCKPEAESDELSLVERIRKLERALEQGGAGMYGGMAGAYGGAGMYGGSAGGYGSAPGGSAEMYGGAAGGYGSAPGGPAELYGGAGGYSSAPGGTAGVYGGDAGGYGSAPGGAAEMSAGALTGAAGYPGAADAQSGYARNAAAGGGQNAPGSGGAQAAPGPSAGGYGAPPYGYYGRSGVPGGAQGFPPAGAFPPAAPVKAAPEDLKQVCAMWRSIIGGTTGMFRQVLSSSTPKYNAQDEKDGRLYVVFADFLGEHLLTNAERKAELEQLIEDRIGKHVEVKFVLAADEGIQRGQLSRIELDERIREMIHTEIEIED